MHSKDFLAQQLRAAGLDAMADKAATGWYHDYMSPLDSPAITLADDLAVAAAKADINRRPSILALRKCHLNGDFDATKEESDQWAQSEEAKATFGKLYRR